ncbi:MAG: hypothetical protein U9M90_04605 [Patescibacteria group bacterium]|nr:hypothetical protein [Patescibacteria group bacterium]
MEDGKKGEIMEKWKIWVLIPAVMLVLSLFSACAAPQAKYRTKEFLPFANVKPLEVNPNVVENMSRAQYEEYMRRLKEYNVWVRDTAYANAYTAYGEKQWVNNEEGGPPIPPQNNYGIQSFSPSVSVFGKRSEEYRRASDELWQQVKKELESE